MWRCFHCGEVFTDEAEAALHFGVSAAQQPMCAADAAYVRDLEHELARYREDDSELEREYRALQSRRRLEVQRAEEAGYARGVRDVLALRIELSARRDLFLQLRSEFSG